MSKKNSNDTIGNRTRDFPGCSAVHQRTAPPDAPCACNYTVINKNISIKFSQEPVDILLATVSILLFLHPFYIFDIFITLYLKDWCINIIYSCLLQQIIEGKLKGQIEVTRRRGRRRKKLLDDLKDRRGYCQLKEEALDRTVWRNRFGRGFGPVV